MHQKTSKFIQNDAKKQNLNQWANIFSAYQRIIAFATHFKRER